MQIKHLALSGWLCHRHFDQPFAPLTVVCGPNHSGKSAIRDGIAFALTSELCRVRLKGDRAQLLSEGAKSGAVRVSIGDGRITRDVATGRPASDNQFHAGDCEVSALPFVLDRERFGRVDANERRLLLQEVMRVDLGPEGLLATLEERGHSTDLLNKFSPRAPVSDWLEQAERGASEARGAWKAITNSVYGSEKAKGWQAPGPVNPPTQEEVEDASAATDRLLEKLRVAQVHIEVENVNAKQTAHEQDQIAGWQKLAATLADEKALLDAADLEIKEAETANEKAAAALTAATDKGASDAPVLSCPHCQTALRLEDYDLVHATPTTVTPADLTALRKARDSSDQVLRNATKLRDIVRKRWAFATAAEINLKEAKVLPKIAPTMTVAELKEQITGIQIDMAVAMKLSNRLTIEYAEAVLAGERTAKANGYHEAVLAWVALRDALQPDGVPGELLTSALQPFNAILRTMAGETGWPQVTLTSEMDILYGNRAHGLLSRSERWRADAMLAVALAIHSEVKMVALDEFDVLDVASRGQAMGWLYGLTKGVMDTVIVLATLKAAPPVPPDVGVIWLGHEAPPATA